MHSGGNQGEGGEGDEEVLSCFRRCEAKEKPCAQHLQAAQGSGHLVINGDV